MIGDDEKMIDAAIVEIDQSLTRLDDLLEEKGYNDREDVLIAFGKIRDCSNSVIEKLIAQT